MIELRIAAMLGDQDQRLDRGLPYWRVVLGFGELGDVVRGVPQGDEFAAAGQGDWIVEGGPPRINRQRLLGWQGRRSLETAPDESGLLPRWTRA
jgi:hypothetical protein